MVELANALVTATTPRLPARARGRYTEILVLESAKSVPNKPMRWQLQTETKGKGSHSGHLMVDWVSAWAYAGSR